MILRRKRKRKNNFKDMLPTYLDPRSPAAEAYRTFRTNIEFTGVDEEINILAVTSTTPREGKSTVVSNLGISYAMAGMSTLIIDCDLRKSVQHKIFQLNNSKGLTSCLRYSKEGIMDYEDYIHESMLSTMDIMTSGPSPPNPTELLGSNAMKALISYLGEKYERIILDTPPILVAADASVVSHKIDGFVVVFDWGHVRKDEAGEALDQLKKANAPILGGVLNNTPMNKRQYYYYYEYYNSE